MNGSLRDNRRVAGSDPDWLRRAERAEFRRLLHEALTSEDVLLYDATGKPIIKGSNLWSAGAAECRRRAHHFLGDLLDRLPFGKIPTSPEELTEALKNLSHSDPKYTLDVVDGKLSLPFSFTVGQVKIKAHIPLYRLGVLAAGVIGLWLARARAIKREPPKPHPPANHARQFPTRRIIRLGTYESSEDLAKALEDGGFRITRYAGDILQKIVIAPVKTEIELVTVTPEIGTAELDVDLVPAEVGPQLRLQHPDQLYGERLIMAMAPIAASNGYPHVFSVGRDSDGRWLDAEYSYPGFIWGAKNRWVFARRNGN